MQPATGAVPAPVPAPVAAPMPQGEALQSQPRVDGVTIFDFFEDMS